MSVGKVRTIEPQFFMMSTLVSGMSLHRRVRMGLMARLFEKNEETRVGPFHRNRAERLTGELSAAQTRLVDAQALMRTVKHLLHAKAPHEQILRYVTDFESLPVRRRRNH